MDTHEITRVGALKAFLETLSDDTILYTQVVGQKEGAWSMCADICGPLSMKWDAPVYQLRISHPDLLTLPEFD